MSQPRTFQPTKLDYERAQLIINQLAMIVRQATANGGSCIPELNVTINSDDELKAYTILMHSGHGDIAQTHTGWIFKYRPKGAQPGQPILPTDPMRQLLSSRDNFWSTFEKVRSGS